MGCHFFLQGIFPPRDWTHVSCISCTGRQGLYQLSHQGSPLFIFYLGWFSHKATITITLFWTRYLEMEVKIKIHAEKWNIQTDNGQTIHDNRPMNWPYMQLAQNRHNLINDCQLPFFITLLLTQDQPEKSQICSLIYHIGYPASSQPVASNANNLQSEHTWSFPFPPSTLNLPHSPACLWICPKQVMMTPTPLFCQALRLSLFSFGGLPLFPCCNPPLSIGYQFSKYQKRGIWY